MQFALAYPEAWEDHPWDETVVKVRKKVFVFTGWNDGSLYLTVKLPTSAEEVLTLDSVSPTGYGLGRRGWVSAMFPKGTKLSLDLAEEWIDESYRAIAPKTLVRQLPPLSD